MKVTVQNEVANLDTKHNMVSLRWLRTVGFHRRQGCAFICVAALLWAATVISINTNSLLVNRETGQIKTEVIRLSEQYIRALARDNEGVVDGPYAGRFTAYDLKKTMAVLLENILERMDLVERRLNITTVNSTASSHERTGDNRVAQSVHAKDLIGGEDEQCQLTEKEKQLYPKCLSKVAWMQAMWQSDPCYEAYGVDGSTCSFIMYLSEVEGWCPRSAWHGSAKAPANTHYTKANITTELAHLMDLLKDPNERQVYAWIRMRIKRIWPRWQQAITRLAKKQDLAQRKQQKVLVHLGLLSKQSGWKFAENQFKGGPLGELVQWSDLITSLYVLGHHLTITSEAEHLSMILSQLPAANSPCQSRKDLPVHIIYTDIVGLKQFKKFVKNGYGKFSCLLRIVDSFGTEPAFNLRSFAKQRKKLTSWGGQDLQPQQFFTMFPHSPDNSFMGFVVERYLSETSTEVEKPRKNMAVVYGKNTYMWQGKEDYLNVLNKTGISVHGTVYVEQTENSENIPDYVVNHGILNGEELHGLLRQAKIFVGLGFPYEGPAPLEAIANGAVFLNPKFSKPKNRNTDPFFKGKPTERALASQHPYAEQFIGEPYVYTLNIEDTEEIRTTIQKILDADQFKGYMPYEYTEEGFIQRMNAYIEHQNFCQFQKKPSKWPPDSAMQLLFGEAGKSCKDVCWEKNLICEPVHFLETNAHSILIRHGAPCASNKTLVDIFYPALDTKTNDCIVQQEELLFSCVGRQENLRRLCPCRSYIKGQTALCVGCDG